MFDLNGRLLPRTLVKVENSFDATPLGGSEIDADACFAKVVETVDAVLVKSEGIKGHIDYITACSFWHSLLGVNDKGRPTTKVLGWADTQSRKYTESLKKRFDEHTVHNRTGAHFHSSFWPAKLLWLRREFPEVFARTAQWLSFSDYVVAKLFGNSVTSVSMASGTGIFDIRRLDWDDELLRFLRVKRASLPTVESEPDIFRLNSKFARRWPRLRDARWFPAIGDGAADNLGSGCVTPGKAALMIGTSGAMRILTGAPPPEIPAGLWCYRVDRQRSIMGGALSDGGGLHSWLTKNLRVPRKAEDEIRRRGAATHGLNFMPFLFGERSTGYREAAVGGILGLTASHDSTDILQAAMEGVAYRFADVFERINGVVKINEIVTSGGSLRESPVWTQIVADVLGRNLSMSKPSESSLRGAVLLALESLGKIDRIEDFMTPVASTLAYHPTCHAAYNLARERHKTLYRTLNK